MKIQAYTLPGCSSCSRLKKLFQRANVEYSEIMIKRDISVDDFSAKYSSVKSFPFVVIDDNPIGGLLETATLFVKTGLVSSDKK